MSEKLASQTIESQKLSTDNKTAGFSLKDQLFNKNRVVYLAERLQSTDAEFDAAGFVRDTLKPFKQLELKQRIAHIAEMLQRYLPSDFRASAKQIIASLPPPLDPSRTDDDFGDFIFAPLGEFVVRNGLAKKHLKLSLRTLKEITQRFSMEDAIRAFLDAHTAETLAELERWATDGNYHVRRLVSEGTRPLLPWSRRLSLDIATPLPLLEVLHADPTRYVTRSVANHLNDISKSQPHLVLEAFERWQKAGQQTQAELDWMQTHALRTLVKQGNPQALRALGYRPNPKVDVTHFQIVTPRVTPGEAVEFSFQITAERDEALMIDYVVDFVKANGSLAPKVHKLKKMLAKAGPSLAITKRHPLRANASTFKLYPGTHYIRLQINGKSFGKQAFELT